MAGYEILLLDDGSHVLRTLAWVLAYKGHQVTRAVVSQVFLEVLHARKFDLIIAQVTLNRAEQLEVLKEAKRLNPQALVMVLSGEHETAFPLDAYSMELDDYVLMPCSQAELWRRVAACLKRLAGRRLEVSSRQGFVTINKRVHNRLRHTLGYIRQSLDYVAKDLSHLTQRPQEKMDEGLRQGIRKVSARVEVLMDITAGFQKQISVTKQFPLR